MNLSEARLELAARGFDYLGGGRMNLMLNKARNAFEDYWPFPWLANPVLVGPAPLAIVRLKHVLYVQDTDHDTELYELTPTQLAQDGTPLDQPGLPGYWWLDQLVGESRTMRVWPVAAVNLQAGVTLESPELQDDDDTPLIPVRYHGLWIDLAVVEAYKDSDNFAGAQALRGDINGEMVKVIERYETVNRQHSRLMAYHAGLSEDD